MHITDLIGDYLITGKNQNGDGTPYKGTLTLGLEGANRLNAIWKIGESQIQYGQGFFSQNQLVINFYYTGDDGAQFFGVVSYTCDTPNVLNGIWSEEMGNPDFVGEEKAVKLKREFDD